MATLGLEGVRFKEKTDVLGGGGGEKLLKLSTVGTMVFTTSNNLLLLCVIFRIVQRFSPHAFQKSGGGGICTDKAGNNLLGENL